MIFESLKKIKESFLSTLPVVAVVLILFFTKLIDLTSTELIVFIVSAILVIVGMFLFNIGAETAMYKMGESVGASVTKKKSIIMIVVVFFLFGLFITVAEPDLSVLASQVPIPSITLILVIGVGVGIFIVIGAFRILFNKSLKLWILAFYGLMFALVCLLDTAKEYIPLALDSGGVTTGPITVPFILAIGVGLATSRGGNKNSDSFGLVAFASIGPILMVLILALFLRNNVPTYTFEPHVIGSNVVDPFINAIRFTDGNKIGTALQVFISTAPILVFYFVYDFFFLKTTKTNKLSILSGIVYVYIGLVLFMTAVEAGFLPIGQKLGMEIGNNIVNGNKEKYLALLIGVGAILGIAAVLAEPAVHVLTNQIENVSDGAIKRKSVYIALAIGNGAAIALAACRVYFQDINILYFIVPGYIIAFFMSFLVPDIYSAIAFDSGGVVSGPMNSTFILPYTIGACVAINGGNSDKVLTDAFGTIALVALAPLICIQFLGIKASVNRAMKYRIARLRVREENDNQVIHFN